MATKCRISHKRCAMEKSVLKNFAKFTGKHLSRSLFFNKIACLRETGSEKNYPRNILTNLMQVKSILSNFKRNIIYASQKSKQSNEPIKGLAEACLNSVNYI